MSRKCPCGERTSPDPSCDMCDGFRHDPDTGWGGFTDHFTGKHYNSEEEQRLDQERKSFFDDEEDEEDGEGFYS